MEPMVTTAKVEAYRKFADRLNKACDTAGLPKDRGRASELGRLVGVTYKGAGKWLTGEGMPDVGHGTILSSKLNVSFEWLYTGRQEEKKGTNGKDAHKEVQHTLTAAYRRLAALVERWPHLTDETQKSLLEQAIAAIEATTHGLPPPPFPPKLTRRARVRDR